MNREPARGLIQADAKFMDERDDIRGVHRNAGSRQGTDEKTVRAGYERFKEQKTPGSLSPSPKSTA